MTNIEQNVQVIQQIYQAFGQGDVPGVLALVSPDANWVNYYGRGLFPGQWGKPCHGHDEIMDFFRDINEAVEVRGFEPYKFIAQGDDVAVLVNWKGLTRKTGQAFDTLLAHVWTLRDGKVANYIGLDDPTAYSFQVR